MSKPKVSLLEAAMNKDGSAAAPVTVTATSTPPVVNKSDPPVPKAPWYAEVLERYSRDREERAWLVEQVTASLGWGGDNLTIKVPFDTFMAMLEERRKK